jgi:hypothetical protein
VFSVWSFGFLRSGVIADVREAEVGSQSADTIKLNFVRSGRLGLSARGTPASWDASRSAPLRRKICTILISVNRDARRPLPSSDDD